MSESAQITCPRCGVGMSPFTGSMESVNIEHMAVTCANGHKVVIAVQDRQIWVEDVL